MTWRNEGAKNGLWYDVTDGTTTLKISIGESAVETVDVLNKLESKVAVMLEALECVYHQLSTDSDLDEISGMTKYQALTKLVAKAIAKADPSNPQIRFNHEAHEE